MSKIKDYYIDTMNAKNSDYHMLPANEKNEDYYTLVAMEEYGGSFVKSLARLANTADSVNYSKLKTAFINYWEEYSHFANDVRTKNKS